MTRSGRPVCWEETRTGRYPALLKARCLAATTDLIVPLDAPRAASSRSGAAEGRAAQMAADPQNLAPARSVDEDKLIAGHHFRFHFGRRRPSPSGSHLTGTIVFITWVFYIATEIVGTFGEFTRLVLNLFAPAWATKFLGKALVDGKALFEALILDPPQVWRCPVEKPGILTAALRTFFPSLAAPKACGQWWRPGGPAGQRPA